MTLDNATKNALVSGALTSISEVSFDVLIPGINVTLSFAEAGAHNISLNADLNVTPAVSLNAGTPPNLQLQVVSGFIDTNNSVLDDILNESILPYLRDDIDSVRYLYSLADLISMECGYKQ
jgi:hypothetical protein